MIDIVEYFTDVLIPVDLALRYAKEVRSEFANFGMMVDLSHLPLLWD